MELITMTLLWTRKLAYGKNITYEIIMQENRISHVFRNFPVYDRHWTEEMTSCSRVFREPKNAEGEEVNRKWYPKVNKGSEKEVFEKKNSGMAKW